MNKYRFFMVIIVILLLLLTNACQQGRNLPKIENTAEPQSTTEPQSTAKELEAEETNQPQPTAEEELSETLQSATESVTDEPIVIEPESGTGVIKGFAISKETTKPLTDTFVMLADVYREGDVGAYVLDAAHSPFATSDIESGFFLFSNVPPGEYVIVIGDPYGKQGVAPDESGEKVGTWLVEENKVLDVGELHVVLKFPNQ